ncbi:MAG: hypothetical protein KDB82_08130 [Planctomycetes bacterium]|nr:hypothetical protein [Planctomycetota bacterium]
MKGKTFWLGMAGVWLVAGMLAALFVLGPDSGSSAKPAFTLAESADEAAPNDAPLEGESSDESLPEAPKPQPKSEPAEKISKTPEDESTEEAASKRTTEVKETLPPIRPEVSVGAGETKTETGSSLHGISVAQGGTLKLQQGEVSIDGDLINQGKLDAAKTTLVLDGGDQSIEGNITAGKVILRGGTKRIRKGTFGTGSSANADPGKAQLYVEKGTTLVIEEGGKWTTPNAYGFQIAGSLVIDGGEFQCRFTNGNGTDRGEESWLPGSELTIYKGKFVGNGDADFSGATITIHDGALEINDDIWSTGDALNMYGGSMRNTKGGGMFCLTGTVNISDGKLQVYQNSSRSLNVYKDTSVFCSGGEISINGNPAGGGGGIVLYSSATLNNLKVNTSTQISTNSKAGTFLSISRDFEIAKGQRFNANGYQVIAAIPSGDNQGEFVP